MNSKHKHSIALMIASSCCVCLGQLLWKLSIIGSAAALFLKRAAVSAGIRELIKNKNLYTGGGLYFIAAIINIYVLRYLDYSTVLPLTSLTYIWTMILSRFILKEKMTIRKAIGAIGIVIGTVVMAGNPPA
jgi:drug/metabolite transporter (DMT)-like permease